MPDTKEVARLLEIVNQNPFKNVDLTFRESDDGSGLGATVEVTDEKPWQIFSLINNTGSDDTGDWRTLASFGHWAATCYPAEHYLVVVSGHGKGWSEYEDASGQDAAHFRSERAWWRASASSSSGWRSAKKLR